jgi:hypothetical protein
MKILPEGVSWEEDIEREGILRQAQDKLTEG